MFTHSFLIRCAVKFEIKKYLQFEIEEVPYNFKHNRHMVVASLFFRVVVGVLCSMMAGGHALALCGFNPTSHSPQSLFRF
jgi:hypothetical protein